MRCVVCKTERETDQGLEDHYVLSHGAINNALLHYLMSESKKAMK